MKQRIPIWSRKVKLLTQHDLDEVEKFRQFLADVDSNMHPTEFSSKWHEYMEVTPLAAEAYMKSRLKPPAGQGRGE